MKRTGFIVMLLFTVMVFATCHRDSEGTPAAQQEGDAGPIRVAANQSETVGDGAESAGSNETSGQPVISFERTEFDFGVVDQGDPVEHVFQFKNTGNGELIIEKVRSS